MTQKHASSTPALSRRGMLIGAGTAGATVVAVAALPLVREVAPATTKVLAQAPEAGGGYQLTEHVKRYYQTARV